LYSYFPAICHIKGSLHFHDNQKKRAQENFVFNPKN
jgi:hypothetical protein